MAQLQDPPRFEVLNRGELVDTDTQTEESPPVTTRMDASTQVSESRLDSPGCDPGDGDTLEDDRKWTTGFEGVQGGQTIAEVHTEQDISETSPEPAPWTPLKKLEMEYERCMWFSAEDLDLERGVPGETSPEDESRMRAILKRHRKIFLGDKNAAPAPARGVVCDLDVGDVKLIALSPRSIGPHVAVKVYELLKKLLENNQIEHSESQWASPIVIVLKKNGVDMRMCMDYRLMNNFIHLSSYPLPLIDDLLVGFQKALWFMSLDMASGFWAIKMTERAKSISTFDSNVIWSENKPLIYQQVINNCLWGFVRLPPEEEAEVDQEVLDYLNLDPQGVALQGAPVVKTSMFHGCCRPWLTK
ncbi:reverse transcriptase [Phytophthora megakarya]|uniref:Reverse transcriptase n=1 Tax=Phytophthora megakarya TaxID=4795 RepID=A0A225VMD7_9STRA|nr:reverse transcriptase [Phytophthora megakarya]